MTSPLRTIVVLACGLAMSIVASRLVAQPTDTGALQLEGKIPLGDVRGRIDHMAIDLARQRLFVAALGHDGLAVVDLKAQRLDRIIGGLREPQGVGYDGATD